MTFMITDSKGGSWRYMNCEHSLPKADLEGYKIGGANLRNHDIMAPYMVGKGGGSAYGGDWKPSPNKPDDQRLIGPPNTVNTSGAKQTHIGEDGKADYERHNTDHGQPHAHTNPHDHKIDWSGGYPSYGPPINYPNGAPSFNNIFKGAIFMNGKVIPPNTHEQNRFTSISDFKWSMKCGGEVVFIWRGTKYCCFGNLQAPGVSKSMMYISKTASEEGWENSARWCDNADEVLEYLVGMDRLRDVITQVNVIERTI